MYERTGLIAGETAQTVNIGLVYLNAAIPLTMKAC